MQQLRSLIALCVHITRYSLGHSLLLLHKLHLKNPGGCVQHTCTSVTMKALAALGLPWVASWLCYGRSCYGYFLVMLWLLLWLLCQPGERLCYGHHAGQEGINVPALPTDPCIFFQTLSSSLAYPWFSEQCKQCEYQDNSHNEQNPQHIHLKM